MSNNSVLVGAGAPAAANGVNGDYYFDNVSEKYYIKANGIWQDRGSLKHVWQASGKNIYFNQGSIGVGTAQPQESLHIDRGSLLISNTTNYTLESLGYYQSTSPADASLAGFDIVDERAYLAYGTAGLVIVDVSNPTQPAALTSYKVGQDCRVNGVHVSGSIAFVACGSHGVHVVDVSDPYNAALQYTYAVGSAGATGDVYSVGLNIYLASGNNLVVLEVDSNKSLKNTVTYSGGTAPGPTTAATLVGFAIRDALVLSGSGSYIQKITCYLNYGSGGLQIVDFTDPSAPTLAYQYTPGHGRLQSLRLAQDMALLALGSSSTTTSGGIEVLDITNPHEPQLLTQYSTDISVVDLAVREDGNLVYLIGNSNSIELVELRRVQQSGTMTARRLKQLTVEHLQSTNRIVIALRPASPDDSSRVYVAGAGGGLEIVDVAEEGTSASFDGSVTIGGGLYLGSLKEGALSIDKSGAVRSNPKELSAKLYEDRISPWLRIAGETSIYLATNYGQSVLKWDIYGLPTATVRTAINALVFTEGFESVDLLNWWRDAFQDVDSIITNTGIAVNSYNIELLRTALGWVEVPGATVPLPTPNTGWARQLGRFIESKSDDAIVIGTGIDATTKLENADPGTIMLGSRSPLPSLVIQPGKTDPEGVRYAGAVAIGHSSYVAAQAWRGLAIGAYVLTEHVGAVVIGSGLEKNKPLKSAAPGTVTIGAGSPLPSLVIQPGTQNDAGAAAIGHASQSAGARSLAIGPFTSTAKANAVVIGSGISTDNRLVNDVENTVVLGAGSPLPSLVIRSGAQEADGYTAGSVAIGHYSVIAHDGKRSVAIGPYTSADRDDAVVIGSGPSVFAPLENTSVGSVVLGAGSNIPSLVIEKGLFNTAGAVAIGHASQIDPAGKRSLAIGSYTKAAAGDAVVIGSGISDNPLVNNSEGSVVLGAGSYIPSLVIQKGSLNAAGAVAIGHASQIDPAGKRSLAIGSYTKAAADDAVVIGSGMSGNLLVNNSEGSVVLGAGSPKPSLVIQKGTPDAAGTVAVGANLIPLVNSTWTLGDSQHRWKEIHVNSRSIHIGEDGNESVISYDTQAHQLDLGAIKVDNITLTGLAGCTEGTNFVAVDSAGKLICAAAPGGENADRAEQAADEAKQSAAEAKGSAAEAKGSAAKAAGSVTLAAGSVTTAGESAIAAGKSAVAAGKSEVAAGLSAAAAGISAGKAGTAKSDAEVAAGQAQTWRDEAEGFKTAAEQAKTDAETAATGAAEAKDAAVQAKSDAQAAASAAQGARDEAEGFKTAAEQAQAKAEAAAASVSQVVTTTVANWASLLSNRPLWMDDNKITDANSALGVIFNGSNSNVFLFSTTVEADSGGANNKVVSRFYRHDGWQWRGLPALLQDELPTIDDGQQDVQETLDHYLLGLPGPSSSSPLLAVGALANYAPPAPSPEQREEGFNALFLGTYDGRAWDMYGGTWSGWRMVTPVEGVANAAVAADANGLIYFAWDTSTSRAAGQIKLATFNPSTNEVGEPEVVADTMERSATNIHTNIDLTVTPAGDVWITYTASDGLYVRLRNSSGQWASPLLVVNSLAAHASAWAEDTLWVVAQDSGTEGYFYLYQLTGGGFQKEAGAVFATGDYKMPELAATPEGGVIVAARLQDAVVVQERASTGERPPAYTVVDNFGQKWARSLSSSSNGVWVSGIAVGGQVMVAQRRTTSTQQIVSLEYLYNQIRLLTQQNDVLARQVADLQACCEERS